jgi:hypothetical protein
LNLAKSKDLLEKPDINRKASSEVLNLSEI